MRRWATGIAVLLILAPATIVALGYGLSARLGDVPYVVFALLAMPLVAAAFLRVSLSASGRHAFAISTSGMSSMSPSIDRGREPAADRKRVQPPRAEETQDDEVIVIDDLEEPIVEREKKPSPGPSIDRGRVDIRKEAKRFWSEHAREA